MEAIIDKVADLIKSGKIREISDMRDETDLKGLKIAIELKRGSQPEDLMKKLFKLTPLEDTFNCNFNMLLKGTPRVLGVKDILNEWISWRCDCIARKVLYERDKKTEKLHLLEGLKIILDNLDDVIDLIRSTQHESEVVANLMCYGLDEVQAEYVAEIKLRNLNVEYIEKRIKDIQDLMKDIAELDSIWKDEKKIRNIIVKELQQIIKKYPSPRRTSIVME